VLFCSSHQVESFFYFSIHIIPQVMGCDEASSSWHLVPHIAHLSLSFGPLAHASYLNPKMLRLNGPSFLLASA